MLTAILRTFHLWRERRRADQELAALDDRLLEDIGLSRHDVPRDRDRFWS
ncbi:MULTISPECIES: DUF1127 domain-containing protein [Methylobacterium]|nr:MULTISPECIES: DUF1127 domain-containing protein [Methylobacterium]MDR7039606.1 uncharacterized protein YjiS (DUF1127 family) [Methylobacterium sp. BE186]